jgi:hypothetical protein
LNSAAVKMAASATPGPLEQIDGARVVLDALGWPAARKPAEVQFAPEHRGALLDAVTAQLEADEGHLESLAGQGEDDPDRQQAAAHVRSLEKLRNALRAGGDVR